MVQAESYFWKVSGGCLTSHLFIKINIQSGEHHVAAYRSLTQPCWGQFLKKAEDKYCKLDLDEFPSVSFSYEIVAYIIFAI